MLDDRLTRIVTGKKGAGKTMYCVQRGVEALMSGDVLVTNIQLNWEEVVKYAKKRGVELVRDNYRFLSMDEIMANPMVILDRLASKSTLVLDEAHLVFDSREYAKTKQTAGGFQAFLRQGRKVEVDAYLITQASANLDSRMVRQGTYHIDLSNWHHFPVLGQVLPFPFTLIKTRDSSGFVLAREWWWRPRSLHRLYDTRQRFLGLNLGGAPPVAVQGARRRKLPYSMGLIAVGLALVLGSRGYEFLKGGKQEPVVVAPVAGAESVPAPPANVGQVQAVSDIDRVEFESSLPRLRKVTPAAVQLDDGSRLVRGMPFGLGSVIRWQEGPPGVVTVYTDSKQLPQIKLYESVPHLYRGVRAAGLSASEPAIHNGRGLPRESAAIPAGLTPAPAPSSAVPAYSPPEPFIPAMRGPDPAWAESQRLPNAREVWKRGKIGYEN